MSEKKDFTVFLRYAVSGKKLHKFLVKEEDDAQVILDEVKRYFGVNVDCQILRFKREGLTVKIVAGWSIGFYEMNSKTVIEVESSDDHLDSIQDEAQNNSTLDKKRVFLLSNKAAGTGTTLLKQNLDPINEEAEYVRETTLVKPNAGAKSKDEIIKGILNRIKKGEEEFTKMKAEFDDEFYDICDNEGWYPIHYAINYRNKAAVRHLIENKASLDVETKDGLTPLMLCIMKKENEIFKMIIDSNRVNIDKVTKKGTALHYAIESKNSQAMTFLLNKKADPFIPNSNQQTAIDILEDEELKEKLIKSKQEAENISGLKQKPESVRGTCFKTGNFFRNLKQRYLVLDTNHRTLIRYKGKQDVPDKPVEIIPLKDINGVVEVNSKLFLQHGFHYFQVNYGATNLFATKNKSLSLQWVAAINKAVEYSKKYEASKATGLSREVLDMIDKPAEVLDFDLERAAVQKPRQSVSIVPAAPVKVTINLSSFEIQKWLGKGSFGRVYKVKLKSNGRIYAMKMLNKELLIVKKQIKYAQSEANILKLANHPFILSMHFAFQTPNNLFMIIDYCPGGDLSTIIDLNNSLPENHVRFFACELVLAMENLHEMGVLYRDLKPENILIDREGHIKLADFGLSRENVGKNDIARSFCGSHIYLAPEMVSKKGFTQASDNYGIGLCIYEMLYGQLPFYNEDIDKLHLQIRKDEIKFPTDIAVSDEAMDLMLNLLKKNPKERLGSKSKEEIKSHPFFNGVDWNHVLNKQIPTPKYYDEVEDRGLKRAMKVNDKDYTEANKTYQRIPDFSFIRASELAKTSMDP